VCRILFRVRAWDGTKLGPPSDSVEATPLGEPADGLLTATPPSLTFTIVEGATDAATLTITGDDVAPVLSVSAPASWLTVAADSATDFTATVDTAGLAPGDYDGTITFSAPGYESLDVPVSLTVTAAPLGTLTADPTSLTFDVVEGDTDDALVTVTGDGVALVLSVSAPASWLTVAADSATDFTATVDTAGLAPGDYDGTITFSAPGYESLDVPVSLTVTASPPGEPGEVLYRVNAGGPQIASIDDGPAWSADLPASSPSPYVNHGTGNNQAYSVPAGTVSAPPGVPAALFQTERYDPLGGNEMTWNFPVEPNFTYQVSLHLSEKYFGVKSGIAGGAAKRVFDVAVEGNVVLDDLDLTAQLGAAVGGVFTFQVPVTDDALTIEFIRSVENPTIDAIEIRQVGPPLSTLTAVPSSLGFDLAQGTSDTAGLSISGDGAAPVLSVSAPASWLTVGADSATDFTVTASAIGLEPGDYTSNITFSAPGYAPLIVPVSLTVIAAPLDTLTADPPSLTFEVARGETDVAIVAVSGDGEPPVLSLSAPALWLSARR
jgi:hypothetical protein